MTEERTYFKLAFLINQMFIFYQCIQNKKQNILCKTYLIFSLH